MADKRLTNREIQNKVYEYFAANGFADGLAVKEQLQKQAATVSAAQATEYNLDNDWKKAYFAIQAAGNDIGPDIKEFGPQPKKVKTEAEKIQAQKDREEKAKASAVSLDKVGEHIAQQLIDRAAELQANGKNTSIVRLIKREPDLADVVIDKNNASFVVDPKKAVNVLEKMEAEEGDVTPETKEVYDRLKAAVSHGTPIQASISQVSNSWVGVEIKTHKNETKFLSREEFKRYIIFNTYGYINTEDETAPTAKVKKVAAKTNANSTGKQEDKITVTIGNMKEVNKDRAKWWVDAQVKSSGDPVPRRTKSAECYQVYVMENGKRKTKKKDNTAFVTRKRYIPGMVDTYPVVKNAELGAEVVDNLLAKKSTKSSTRTKSGLKLADANAIVSIVAKGIQEERQNIAKPGAQNPDPSISEALKSFSFTPIQGGDKA